MTQNKKPTVVIIGPYPPPYGGIASHLQGFIPELIKNGYNVFVITRSKKESLTRKENLIILRVNLKRKWYHILNFKYLSDTFKSFVQLKSFGLNINEILRELVLVNLIRGVESNYKIAMLSYYDLANGYSIPVLKNLREFKMPMVITIYANIYESTEYFLRRRLGVKAILESSDKMFSSSRYAAQSLKLLNLDPGSVQPVYYGIDLERYSPAVDFLKFRQDYRLSPQAKILLFVGRMNAEMGLDIILELIPRLATEQKEVVIFIVGARDQLTRQAEALQELYRGAVFVKADVSGLQLPYFYAACDVLLAPTKGKHASMGMSIKEAMATGRPVIATDSPGIREAILHQVTGLLITTGLNVHSDAEQLYSSILWCLHKPLLCKEMGNAARKRAEEIFDQKDTFSVFVNAFKELISNYAKNILTKDSCCE